MAGRELDELFRAWRSEPVPPSLPPSVDARGGSAVVAAALRRVAEQKRQKSRFRKLSMAAALAAAVSGLGVGAWFELAPDTTTMQASAALSVSVGGQVGEVAVTDDVGHVVDALATLTEGYGVRTEQGSATLAFPSGASAKVEKKSSLKITRMRESEALFLARGAVDVEVPKLDAKRGFSVETPDARVTVHGTSFRVFVEGGPDGPQTSVRVTHGIVSVQQGGREVFLTAGQSFPTDRRVVEDPAAPAAVDAGFGEDEEEDEPPPSGIEQKKHGFKSRTTKPRKFDSRELADQNERFARAMALKKNGEGTAALLELGRILRRYPGSPLTQELRVERLRLLRSLDRAPEAMREARYYLREFPQGYAAAEAHESLSEKP